MTADYPAASRRPLNSRVDCSTFTREFGVRRPEWRQALEGILKELRNTA
jgi:dTDP-4-dehydrorhamnose reductase